MVRGPPIATCSRVTDSPCAVNLGKSGLKVSKVILGAMTYGSSKWQKWVLDEEESIKHIKAAYDAGINTFDTADVGTLHCFSLSPHVLIGIIVPGVLERNVRGRPWQSDQAA
jgi:Aldo/keto reductase family